VCVREREREMDSSGSEQGQTSWENCLISGFSRDVN